MMKKLGFMLAMMVGFLASCSDGGSEDPVNPTPKPDEVKAEITMDAGIVSNGLSFGTAEGEQSVSFSVNADWTLSIASTTGGTTWCKASATSGSEGSATVKFTVAENTDYDDRSVSVTIKAGTASKTFTITQKGADALLVTTAKFEVPQEGGSIEVEVKANIDYELQIAETSKDWISESKSRALTTKKHAFTIAANEETEKREGEITFKSGDKVETVKVYQAGGAIILLSQNEYTVSDAGETISVDIKSNVEYGVQMPEVDWITDTASGRGMSSHTLKYVIAPNETYDSRSAEIIFYDKNSDLKDTLKVVQAQKDVIVISEKEYSISKEGGTIEVKVNTNVDIEVQIPSDATWVTQTDSRALTEKSVYLKIAENTGENARESKIEFVNKASQISESITISQAGEAGYANGVVTLKRAGTMKELLGDNYCSITSLKVVGPINGDDVSCLRRMLGGKMYYNQIISVGNLTTLDLSEATIVSGGGWYFNEYGNLFTSDNRIGSYMFYDCANLQNIVLPENVTLIDDYAFKECDALASVTIGSGVTSINNYAFHGCDALTSIVIPDNVTSIGYSAFYDCDALASVTIGSSVTSIGEKAFYNCAALTSIVIPDNVTRISSETFYNCDALVSVTIGSGVTSIGEKAFHDCDALTSIVIPDNVTAIQQSAFEDCDALTSVVIPDNVTRIQVSQVDLCRILLRT